MDWIKRCPDSVLPVVNREAPVLGRALAAHAMADAIAARDLLKPFRRCIHCAQPTEEHLTPYHAAYLQMYAFWSRAVPMHHPNSAVLSCCEAEFSAYLLDCFLQMFGIGLTIESASSTGGHCLRGYMSSSMALLCHCNRTLPPMAQFSLDTSW
jgi:hypothetical protein